MSVPQTVLASISSAIAQTISAKSTTAEVSVIINQVFALSLPCGDASSNNSGLSTGAKAGIGVGAAVGGLILITLAVWFGFVAHKHRQKKAAQAQVPANTTGPQMYENKQYSMFPPGSPQAGYPVLPGQLSPPIQQQGYGPHNSWPSPMQPQPGHFSVSSGSMRHYGASSPGLPPGYVSEMPAYQVQARSQTHEMPGK
jgi:hypothetical protein